MEHGAYSRDWAEPVAEVWSTPILNVPALPLGKAPVQVLRDMAATKTLAVERRFAPGSLDTFGLAVVEKANVVAPRQPCVIRFAAS